MFEMNSFVHLEKGKTISDVPSNNLPFFLLAKEGVFFSKPTILGTAYLKTENIPTLGEVGDDIGHFIWDAPIVPAKICAQIVDFFKRIYEQHKTEAQVILTIHKETKEWRVFVPTQKVSGAAVDYVYDPSNIDQNYLVVGTMHSHCNFSPFHSGTDITDANGMDGVHFTVGYVDREIPEVVGMVSMHGTQFHYKDMATLADFSDLKADTAPAWWDRYVIPTANLVSTHKPVGYDNFARFSGKAPAYGYIPHTVSSPKTVGDYLLPANTPKKETAYPYSGEGYNGYGSGDHWFDDYEYGDSKSWYDAWINKNTKPHWEDTTPPDARETILNAKSLTNEDMALATSLGEYADMDFWQGLFLDKLVDLHATLEGLGVSTKTIEKELKI